MSNRKLNFGVLGAGGIAYRRTMPAMLKTQNCRICRELYHRFVSDPEAFLLNESP